MEPYKLLCWEPKGSIFIKTLTTELLIRISRSRKTFDELKTLLRASDQSVTQHSGFRDLITDLEKDNSLPTNDTQDHFVKVCNGLFVQEGYPIRPEFNSAIKSVYRGDIFNVKFGDSSASPFINNWVKKNTWDKIQSMVPPHLDSDTRVLIASTLYFNARWKTTFFDGTTQPKPFYPDGKDHAAISGKL